MKFCKYLDFLTENGNNGYRKQNKSFISSAAMPVNCEFVNRDGETEVGKHPEGTRLTQYFSKA